MNYEKLDEYFEEVKIKIENGLCNEEITTRKLLQILEVTKRGANVNATINEILDKYDLIIEPEFEWEYVDNPIYIKKNNNKNCKDDYAFNYRINSLNSANIKPISIKPDEDLGKAIAIMITNNFSQVPVMNDERNVKGVITWRSIGNKLFKSNQNLKVREVMDKPIIIDDDTSLFEAIEEISCNDYVLVRSQKDSIIKGIVTSSDLSQQFKNLSEPFLLIGRCENLVRKIVHGIFTKEELNTVKNPSDEKREIDSIHDLTFGEYIRLIENKDYWKRLKITIDRAYLLQILEKVRIIRNDIMHFDPSGIDEQQIKELKAANSLLEYCLIAK